MEGNRSPHSVKTTSPSITSGKAKSNKNQMKSQGKKESKYRRNEDLAAEMFRLQYDYEEERYNSNGQHHLTNSNNRKNNPRKYHKARHRSHSISKSEYVQANFRFVISPFMNPAAASLTEPDVPIPWVDVVQVIVTLPPEKSFAEEIMTCPICLGEAQVPRITSCGHVYCCSCIRRHLAGEGMNSLKCPVCTTSLRGPTELKSILIKQSQLPVGITSFVAPPFEGDRRGGNQRGNRKRGESTTSETSFGDNSEYRGYRLEGTLAQVEKTPAGQMMLTFSLLEVPRGRIYPSLPQLDNSQSMTVNASTVENDINADAVKKNRTSSVLDLKDIVPVFNAPNAPYCHTVRATPTVMKKLFVQERCSLLQFREDCKPSAEVVTDVMNEKSAFMEMKDINRASSTIDKNTRDLGQETPQAKRWASLLRNDTDHEGLSSTGSASMNQQNDQMVMAHTYGDVEALPFIDQELQSINDQENSFQQRLKEIQMGGTYDDDTIIVPTAEAVEHKHYAKDDCHYLYQHSDAELLFMHPICSKCLLDAAQQDEENETGACASAHDGIDTTGIESRERDNCIGHVSAKLGMRLLPPTILQCRIIEIETHRVTMEFRQRYPVFRHLPLHCEILLAEVDVKALVPPHVYNRFQDEITKRAAKRKSRRQQQRKELKMERDRQLAESMAVQDRLDYAKQLQEKEAQDIHEWVNGPSLNSLDIQDKGINHESTSIAYGGEAIVEKSVDEKESNEMLPAKGATGTNKSVWGKGTSFANITQMGGHFPTLSTTATTKTTVPPAISNKDAGAATVDSANTEILERDTHQHQLLENPSASAVRGTKKSKKVPLFSTSSVRSYR